MKKTLRILLCVSCFATQWHISMASHIVGGEMSYICLGNDQYQITLKVFRDCFNGMALFDNPTDITIFDSDGNQYGPVIPINFPGSDTLNNDTGNPCLILPPGICVEEADFVTTVTLPGGTGYTLVYQRCCRNMIIVNLLDPSNTGATYLATIPDTALAVCNSSPYYNNFPPTVICVDAPFVFDHSATDPDGDSLVYQLCAPYVGASSLNPYPIPASPPPYGFVTYQAPYTAADPMGGFPPMAIDPATGLLTVTPNTIGNFVVGVCVEEYRNGVFIGEHKRDFQFNVTQCTPSVLASVPSFINNCDGYTITFDNNSIGGTVYHWDFGVIGMTNDTSNVFEPTFTFPDTGVYIVTLMVNPGTTCGDTATASVYIFPTFTGAAAVPDGCEGQPVEFFDQSTASFGTVDSWDWSFGDGGTSLLQDPSHIYSDTGVFTVTLIVGTSLGCFDTVTETITIYPSPPTTVTPSDTTICYLDFVQLNATGTGNFSWQPNYNLSSINSSNPLAGPDVTTTYTVTLSNNFGCFTQDSVTIHVFDTVIVSAGNDTTLCPGQSIQLHATGGGFSFLWTPPTGLSNPNIANPIATPPSTITYVVTSSVGSCVGSDAITITVKPFPAIFAGPDVTICEGDTAQLSVSGGTSYVWSPSGTLNDPFSPTPLAVPNTTTTYTVTGVDINSCDESVTDSEKVIVIPMPDIVITSDTTIILGTCIELSITGGGTYLWFPATGLSDVTSDKPTACPTDPTMYYVWITTVNGCKYLDSVFIDVNPEPLVIFPNAFSPNDDQKNDHFRPVVLGLASIDAFRIFNRWGQVVFEATNVAVHGGPMPVADSWDGKLNGKDQPVGVYVYYLKGTGTATGTIIERHGDVTLVR